MTHGFGEEGIVSGSSWLDPKSLKSRACRMPVTHVSHLCVHSVSPCPLSPAPSGPPPLPLGQSGDLLSKALWAISLPQNLPQRLAVYEIGSKGSRPRGSLCDLSPPGLSASFRAPPLLPAHHASRKTGNTADLS